MIFMIILGSFLLLISVVCGYYIKSFYTLIVIYLVVSFVIPIFLARFGINKNKFIEGGLFSIVVPIFTLDRLFILGMGIGEANIVNFDYFIFEVLPGGMIKIKLFLIALFFIGGTVGAIAKDVFEGKLKKKTNSNAEIEKVDFLDDKKSIIGPGNAFQLRQYGCRRAETLTQRGSGDPQRL